MTRTKSFDGRGAAAGLLSVVAAISVFVGGDAAAHAADRVARAKGPVSSSIAGRYVRRSPAFADMTISPDHGQWRIDVSGSARANPAGATPADCHGIAVGPYVDGVIVAKAVPFEDENMDVSADDLKDRPAEIVVQVSDGRVRIVRSSVENFCGMFSDLSGVYVRVPMNSRQGPR